MAKLGVCPETEWPYDGTPANSDGTFPAGDPAAEKPTDACYKDALDHRATTYSRVLRDLDQMKACLAEGYPFVFGFTVYTKFESQDMAKTGVLSMPGPDEDVVGGHAVLAVGYDDASQTFLVRNSWGLAGVRAATSRCRTPTSPRAGCRPTSGPSASSPDLRGGAGDRRGGTVIPGPFGPVASC